MKHSNLLGLIDPCIHELVWDYDTKQFKIYTPCTAHSRLDPNVEAVKEQLDKRSKAGTKKYGKTTYDNNLSRIEWLQHLQEELMDACVYIEAFKSQLK